MSQGLGDDCRDSGKVDENIIQRSKSGTFEHAGEEGGGERGR